MKKSTYKILMREGHQVEVEGQVFYDRWGIDKRNVETVKENKDGTLKTLSSPTFFLTHIPTGRLVTGAKTQKALKELVELINECGEDDIKGMAKVVGDFWNARQWQG